MNLLELYRLEEAPADFEIDYERCDVMPRGKISELPWEEESDAHLPGVAEQPQPIKVKGISDYHEERGFEAKIYLRSLEFFKKALHRGPGGPGYILDVEVIYWPPLGDVPGDDEDDEAQDDFYDTMNDFEFIYHSEKTYATLEEALAAREKMMRFIDSQTVEQLMKINRSGKRAMSKMAV